jgi:hypothetical protein
MTCSRFKWVTGRCGSAAKGLTGCEGKPLFDRRAIYPTTTAANIAIFTRGCGSKSGRNCTNNPPRRGFHSTSLPPVASTMRPDPIARRIASRPATFDQTSHSVSRAKTAPSASQSHPGANQRGRRQTNNNESSGASETQQRCGESQPQRPNARRQHARPSGSPVAASMTHRWAPRPVRILGDSHSDSRSNMSVAP